MFKFLIHLLGGYTAKEYNAVIDGWDACESQLTALKAEHAQLSTFYNDALKKIALLEQTNASLMAGDKTVTLSIKDLNEGDTVVLNGQPFTQNSISLLKGTPVQIAIYDKNNALYPSLQMEEQTEGNND